MTENDHPAIRWLDARRRAWLYRIFFSVAALAVIYGLVTAEEAAGWVAVVAAFLGNGLAAVNTSTARQDP